MIEDAEVILKEVQEKLAAEAVPRQAAEAGLLLSRPDLVEDFEFSQTAPLYTCIPVGSLYTCKGVCILVGCLYTCKVSVQL